MDGNLYKRVAQFLLLVVLVVVVVLGYKIWNKPSEPITDEQEPQQMLNDLYEEEGMPAVSDRENLLNYGLNDASTTADGIIGHIIFTSAPLKDGVTNQVFAMDARDELSTPVLLLPDIIQFSAFLEPSDRIAPKKFFADVLHYNFSQISETNANKSHSVQLYDFDEGSLKGYNSISGSYVQNIAWSSENKDRLAYSRTIEYPQHNLDLVSIDNWEVVIVDLSTDKVIKVLRGATQPKWSPDGSKLVVLRSDGLYVVDIEAMREIKVVEAKDGKFLATSMLDVSPDGAYMAWSIAKAGLITMHEITSWGPFASTEIGRIHQQDTEYYWPQFSPDSRYYAVQAIDAAKPGSTTRDNPRLEIRATRGRDVLRSYSMAEFNFNSFFTDTWIEHMPRVVVNE